MAFFNEDKINYIKLKYVLIPRASNILRELFRRKWLTTNNSAWAETDEQGQQFIEGSGKNIYITTSRRRKTLLRSGRVDLWDLRVTSIVLLKFDFGINANLTEQEKKAIELLADIHFDFRMSFNCLDPKEFNTIWENIAEILIKLGDSSDELKKLKLSKVRSMEMKIDPSTPSADSIRQIEMRNRGNKFFKEQKFMEAIAIYTQSIGIQRCKIELALLYSNRSIAYLSLKNEDIFYKQKLVMAKDDITKAIELCPTWYKAHYRIGCIYADQNNLEKAGKHFEIALILDPNNIEIINKLDLVKTKPIDSAITILSRKEFMEIEMINQKLGGSHLKASKGFCYLKGLGS
uniref:Uncharacterized protein n=1 Tax=Strigamia maritima TaxID=126957 RepID=T1J232_STRMM